MDLADAEQAIVQRIRRAKLLVFSRRHRHEIFSHAFQAGLAAPYKDSPVGQPPIPPTQLGLATDRSVVIHLDERLLTGLPQRQRTAAGRAKPRERVGVEHALAHIGHWQGDRARHRSVRKNFFDVRRAAIVHNLHLIARSSGKSRPPNS